MPRPTKVGMLVLEGTRVRGSGSMFDVERVGAPLRELVVPGATTVAIVERPHDLVAPYGHTAAQLARDGADLIISNCGISMAFQSEVVASADRPVIMSSLLLVPLLSRIFPGGIGLLTYDASAMADPTMRRECGWDDSMNVVVGDVRGLESWRSLESPHDTPLPEQAMRDDVLAVLRDVIARGGNRAILVECTAMLPFLDDIRAASGLPVFEICELVEFVRKEVDHVR